MNTRFIAITCLLIVLFLSTEGKRAKRTFRGNLHKNKKNIMLADDPLISVEAFGPRTMIGTCSCTCCEPELAPLTNPVCPNDVIVAVDSSACFRDHHRRMINFLEKLVQEFHKSDNVKFGADKTRLGIMQFSSDIVHAIKLSDFDYYRSPSGSKYLRDDIKDIVRKLEFLGEGAYLNKALNETAAAFARYPRPREILRANAVAPRKVVILLTNGKSHPSVGLTDIEQSISLLKEMGILVYPVSVTRQCVGMSSAEWDEGLCPDTVVLDALANVGNKKEDEFFTMRSGVQEELVNSISCDPFGNLEASAPCNNCSCDCELPIGPPGPIGPRGPKGDFVQGDPGDQGFPGIDGEPGDVGPLGPPGNQGEKGNIGQPGPQGERGLPGEVGPQGGEGEKGDVGPRGPEGEVGEKGDVGPRGPLGPEGDRGPPGPEGDIGEKGDKGGYGDEGPRGPQGPKGEPGIGIKGGPGPRGPPGPKGMVGVPGVPGKTGDKGEHGLCGKPGPAGKSGEIGLPGIDGYDGSAGPPGTQGPRGPEGPQGSRGENGTPGREGDPGSIGLPGSTGPRGTIGPAGPRGQKGEPSNERGPRGDPGADGSKGARGSPGRDGLDGREGPGGEQGPRGDPGFPGPAGTINLEELRPIISEIVRELLPAECVEPPSNIEECKEYPIDLVFLVDGSDSIDREDFSRVKEWILSTVDSFGANGENRKTQLHVDVVQYSEKVQIEVHSFIQSSSDEIRNQVDGIEQMRSGTKTYSGLRFVNEQVSRNIRPGSYKILITLTDGDASEDRDPGAIAEAKSFYNIMVGVGVGDKVVSEELKDFAHGGRVVTVNDFAALEGIVSQIVSDSCREIGQEVARQEASRSQPLTKSTTSETTTEEPAPPDANGEGDRYARCANSRTDIAFLIDGSSSVGDDNFELLRQFLYDFVGSLENIGTDGFLVSILQYNENPEIELKFEDSTSKEVVLSTIKNLRYVEGNTRTGLALETAARMFRQISEQPARNGANQVVCVITDGRSQDGVAEPAYGLRNAGVTRFAVGVTDSAEQEELLQIASTPIMEHIFNVENYGSIASIQENLLQKICNAVRGNFRVYLGDLDITASVIEEEMIPATGASGPTDDEDSLEEEEEGSTGEVSFEYVLT